MNSTGPDRPAATDWYEIRLQGHLAPRWSTLLAHMTVTHDHDTTVLRGPVVDQAALHGLLARVRDIGMPLLSIIRLDPQHPQRRQQSELLPEPCSATPATSLFDPSMGDQP